MLKPYKSGIGDVAVVFAHTGIKKDNNNRIYSLAASILSIDSPSKTFASHIRYPHLTARDRYYSNISRETLNSAPDPSVVLPQLKNFLKDTEVVLTLPYQDNYEEINKICNDKRIVDLGFAVEFFLPHVDSFSPKRLSEYLQKRERKRIFFTAKEVTELSTELIEHICGHELNDGDFPRAAAIRHYLQKSNTLFGSIFLHFARNHEKFFGGIFHPCQSSDAENWEAHLETAAVKRPKTGRPERIKQINVAGLESIYRGLSETEKGFTFRSSQLEYAQHVARAINDAAVLTIEAGTGTGKTQGYLIPVLEYLSRNSDARAVISTYTKSLQNQIFEQEIGFIKGANKIYRDIPVALLKGKSNYICAEKLRNIYEEQWQGRKLLTWLYFVNLTYHFRDADGEQIGQRISHYLHDGSFFYYFQREASARSGCDPRHSKCPAQVVTAEALAARLVVTNHHKLMLLGHDPILGGLFKTYIIDEANHFEHAARNALGREFNSRETSGFLEYLESAGANLLSRAVGDLGKDIKESLAAIADLKDEMFQFGAILRSIRAQSTQNRGHQELPANNALFEEGRAERHIEALRAKIRQVIESWQWVKDGDRCRMLKMQERTQARLNRNLLDLSEQDLSLKTMAEAYIKPNQVITYDTFLRHWTLLSMPVDVSNLIRENFYRDARGLVYTSATIGLDGAQETFKQIAGMDTPFYLDEKASLKREFRHVFLSSPFSPDKMEIIVPFEAPSGDYKNKSVWLKAIEKIVPDLIKKNRGRTLILFSSYQDLETVAQRIGDDIVEAGFPLLVQRNGYPTGDLCDEFRTVKESVLFGVDTFWYGVDFKGDTLTQVIITRIPFPHPGDALHTARKKTMHPAMYMNRYLYDTFIKMKQGMGRLIRCETDYGKVVVLDSRFLRLKDKIITKNTNKMDDIGEEIRQTAQMKIAFFNQELKEDDEPYTYLCGRCGKEINTDTTVCPACKQKLKERNQQLPDIKRDPLDVKKGDD